MTIYSIQIQNRDELELKIELDPNGEILEAELTGIGGPELLEVIKDWRIKLKGNIGTLSMPSSSHYADLMMKSLLQRAQGKWATQMPDHEVCHCRAVSLQKIENAILAGAQTPEKISRWTQASTQCGTCRKDVIEILSQWGLVTQSASKL